MCGIVGIAGKQEPEWLGRMNASIVHRGPDDEGEYHSPDRDVSFVMRRLSIIDIAGGHQPMQNGDGSTCVVFNGEIYNAPQIRARLEKDGRRFRTSHSDTEVLLQLYEEKGFSLVKELNGMFAFVIYDRKRNLLFGARDRMGIKPLYYYASAGRFAFASELKALLTLPIIARKVDRQALFHYMTLMYVPDRASIIMGVCRLPPAHYFVYDLTARKLTVKKYWRLRFSDQENRSEEEWAEILRRQLREAVCRWTLSDVPIACSLSGGIDSAALVGLLAESGYERIKTYSLGFSGGEEQAWNELDLARQVASRWHTDHHEIILDAHELLTDFVRLVWHLDEPYGGGLPSWYVFREIAKDVKVGLTGTGGDELFGNYGKFRIFEQQALARSLLRFRDSSPKTAHLVAALLSPAALIGKRLPPSWRCIGRGRLMSQLPDLLRQPFGRYYYANLEFFSDPAKRAGVLQVHNGDMQDTAVYLQELYDDAAADQVRDGIACVDFRTQLAEEFLFMSDRFSMAHSVEARVPFLDHLLVETVFRIPPRMRTNASDLKYLLKRAVADLIPDALLNARKRGFVIPIKLWLSGALRPLVQQLLRPERLRRQELFRPDFYSSFVLPHLERRADFTWQIWAALMFQIWHVIFIEGNAVQTPAYDWHALSGAD